MKLQASLDLTVNFLYRLAFFVFIAKSQVFRYFGNFFEHRFIYLCTQAILWLRRYSVFLLSTYISESLLQCVQLRCWCSWNLKSFFFLKRLGKLFWWWWLTHEVCFFVDDAFKFVYYIEHLRKNVGDQQIYWFVGFGWVCL